MSTDHLDSVHSLFLAAVYLDSAQDVFFSWSSSKAVLVVISNGDGDHEQMLEQKLPQKAPKRACRWKAGRSKASVTSEDLAGEKRRFCGGSWRDFA